LTVIVDRDDGEEVILRLASAAQEGVTAFEAVDSDGEHAAKAIGLAGVFW